MSEPLRAAGFDPDLVWPGPGDFEWRLLTIPPGVSCADARRMLAEHAEYGRWELARVRLSLGGARQVWLRRKIIRVARTA